jgi:hypothetical protein
VRVFYDLHPQLERMRSAENPTFVKHRQQFVPTAPKDVVALRKDVGDLKKTIEADHPALNPLYRDVLAHYGWSRCRVGSAIPIARGKSKPASCEEDAVARSALRVARRGASVPR